ncbi:hypothetical protein NLJ89_g8356 [Agrocybe chaxingu]|uniref:Uncharacterized protein n=1 Tax=Agrocybe chaxingu TaxID=84603 RepID=A0A9W8JVI0_9AGAR|nr:hypothetical protein NLJ89_g8356 [Agrocybe chaxingu]
MKATQSVFLAFVACVVRAARIPFDGSSVQEVFRNDPFNSHTRAGAWNLTDESIRNSTSNFIFDTANTLLQHWTHTRYRNGEPTTSIFSLSFLIAFSRAQPRPWDRPRRHPPLPRNVQA